MAVTESEIRTEVGLTVLADGFQYGSLGTASVGEGLEERRHRVVRRYCRSGDGGDIVTLYRYGKFGYKHHVQLEMAFFIITWTLMD